MDQVAVHSRADVRHATLLEDITMLPLCMSWREGTRSRGPRGRVREAASKSTTRIYSFSSVDELRKGYRHTRRRAARAREELALKLRQRVASDACCAFVRSACLSLEHTSRPRACCLETALSAIHILADAKVMMR